MTSLLDHLRQRLRQVQRALGVAPYTAASADAPLAEQLDSMGLVEFVAVLANDCGVDAQAIERLVQQQFGTLRQLADALQRAGLAPDGHDGAYAHVAPALAVAAKPTKTLGWLGNVSLVLPDAVQAAAEIDRLLERQPGWLERHAGIRQRHIWNQQDPLHAAAQAGSMALTQAGVSASEVDALIVTSEAPPLLAGLAAALHHRLGCRTQMPALEVGGACTGFLAALWTACSLLATIETILVLCVEAASQRLIVEPGPAGEAAALFGDGATACIVSRRPPGARALPLRDVRLQAHGEAGDCLRVEPAAAGRAQIRMDGTRLARLAIDAMAEHIERTAQDYSLSLADVHGFLVHGGNGRMPALLARKLGMPPDRVWSRTMETANLGSASLPAAWAAHAEDSAGPILWAAAGAGLTSAAALTW